MTDITIKPRYAIEQLINEDCARFRQRSAVCVLRILTEYYRDRLEPETYEQLIRYYEMSEDERETFKEKKLEERSKKRAEKRKEKKRLENEIWELKRQISRNSHSVKNAKECERLNAPLERQIGILESQIVNL